MAQEEAEPVRRQRGWAIAEASREDLDLFGVAELYGRLVGPMLHRWTDWVFYPAVLFCGACILSKRLHDRGRAGWWAGLVLFAVAIIWPYPRGAFGLLFTPVLVWAAVELGFVRGQQGFNGYGADPTA